jgi:hypothetical protein
LGTQQTLVGLNTKYYDLADTEGNIVGKVFNVFCPLFLTLPAP